MEETALHGCQCQRSEPISNTRGLHIVDCSIELNCAEEKKLETKCGHFSIRGYVAEIRKRDWKMTWPFSIADDCNELDEHAHQLPPLSVYEFRWWRCPNCLQKSDAADSGVTFSYAPNKAKDDDCCFCKDSIMKTQNDNSTQMLPSGLRQASQENGGRKEVVKANLVGDGCIPSSHIDGAEKEASVVYPSDDGRSDCTVHPHNDNNTQIHNNTQILPSGLRQASQENEGRKVVVKANLVCDGCIPSLHIDGPEKEASVVYPSDDGRSDCTVHSHKTISHIPEGAKEALVVYPSDDGKSDCTVHSHKTVPCSPGGANVFDSSHYLKSNQHGCEPSISQEPIINDGSILEAVAVKENEQLKCSEQSTDTSETDKLYHMDNAGLRAEIRESISSETEIAPTDGLQTTIPQPISNETDDLYTVDKIEFSQLVHKKGEHEKITADHFKSEDTDPSAKNADAPNGVKGPINELGSTESHENDHDFSEMNEDMDGSDNCNQCLDGQLGATYGTLHQRKARKTRLLVDIIKSDASGAHEKILIFNKDAEIKGIHRAVNLYKEECVASKDLALHSNVKSSFVVCGNKKKHLVGKKHRKTLQIDDNGRSLMSWLKNVAGKVIQKKHGKSKQSKMIDQEVFSSKALPDSSNGGSLPHESGLAKQKSNRKFTIFKKQNMITRVEDKQSSLACTEEPKSDKVTNTAEKVKTECISAKLIQSKSSKDTLLGLGVDQSASHRKKIRDKRRKMPRVDDETTVLIHKGSSATSNLDSVIESQDQNIILMKNEEGTSKMCEQDSLDDIPMEIVELMAKNQQERRLFHDEDNRERIFKMPEAHAGIKFPDVMDFTGYNGTKVSTVLKKYSSVQKLDYSNSGSSFCTTGKMKGKVNKLDDSALICGKYDNSILRTSHQEQSHAPSQDKPFSQCQERPANGLQFPVTFSSKSSDRWPLPCNQFSESCNQDQTVTRENSCRQPFYDGSKSKLFGRNIPHKFDYLCQKSIVCNCSDPSSKRNNNANSFSSKQPDVTQSIQKQKGELLAEATRSNGDLLAEANRSNVLTLSLSHMKQGTECHSSGGSLDLCTNEAISAMNLLRLMDRGACSSSTIDMPMVENQVYSFKKPELSYNHQQKHLIGIEEEKFKAGNFLRHPVQYEFFERSHQSGSSSELLSSVPKIGELPYSFHYDPPEASNSRRHLDFTSRLSKPCRKRKTKNLLLSFQSRAVNSQRSVVHEENVTNEKKGLLPARAQTKNVEMTEFVQSQCFTEICTVNMNPADFTIPGVGNPYLISSRNLKRKNVIPSSGRPITSIDGHKRRRVLKLTSIQGH